MIESADPLVGWSMELPRAALEVGFVAYALVVTALVVLERRRPTATLALVLALIFVPIAGLVAYALFSRRVRRRSWHRSRRPISPIDDTRQVANLAELPTDLPSPTRGLVCLALKTAAAPLRRCESVVLLPTATVAFEAFADAIAAATRTIHCEFYIWRDDPTGRRITALLTERARAGVTVRVLVDHLGSLGIPPQHFKALRDAGGQVAAFGRLRLPIMRGRLGVNFRNHRKLLTVDGRYGYLGGLNIGDEYLGPTQGEPRWRDLAVELSGDAVVGLEVIFLEDWLATTGQVVDLAGERAETSDRFDPRRPLPRERPWQRARVRAAREQARAVSPFEPRPDVPVVSEGPLVQVIPSGPDRPLVPVIAAQFIAAIATANRRVWLATPYFVPDEPLLFALRTAALRGVDLRVLVPAPRHIDVRIAGWAARSYYDEVLSSEGRIFEYERSMLHSKFLIADDICAIGSANMDVRSFHINYEITAMFYNRGFTAQLAALFEGDLAHSREVTWDDRANPGLATRLAEGAARVLSPLL